MIKLQIINIHSIFRFISTYFNILDKTTLFFKTKKIFVSEVAEINFSISILTGDLKKNDRYTEKYCLNTNLYAEKVIVIISQLE